MRTGWRLEDGCPLSVGRTVSLGKAIWFGNGKGDT